jgi:flagellar protein FliS
MDIEISKSMLQMYEYMNRRLIDANIQNDVEVLSEVEGYVIEFRDTWKEVIKVNRQKTFSGDLA